MTTEKAIEFGKIFLKTIENEKGSATYEFVETAVKMMEKEPCEMAAEEYRQRMIQAFHNADCDELIAVCVLPTEKEFEHLEWLLKNHYKKEPCEDAVSRKELLKIYEDRFIELQKMKHLKDNKGAEDRQLGVNYCINILKEMPLVTSQPKTGHWIKEWNIDHFEQVCSECGCGEHFKSNYCPNCGCRMSEGSE